MDGLVAGFRAPVPITKVAFTGQAVGQLHSTLYVNGLPAAGSAPSPGLAGAALTAYTGQIPFPSPVSGQSVYLAGMDFTQSANVGGVLLCDRLWHNSGIVSTTTTAQTVNSVTFPSRDNNGQTLGAGILVGLEVSATTGNVGAITNTTISYTNSLGTSGLTGAIASFPATAVTGTFVPISLASGDAGQGVRSIQSITLGTSYVSGTVNLVAYRIVSWLGTPAANVSSSQDFAQLGLPVMFDNSVPWLIYLLTGTAVGASYATINYAQG